MIIDSSRKQYYEIENYYFDVLDLCKKYTIKDIYSFLVGHEDILAFDHFISDLIEKGLGTLVDDIKLFPDIEIIWDHYSKIKNCIIDVDKDLHDFKKIFNELDSLDCQDIEIRFYSERKLEDINSILKKAEGYAFKYIHILMKYSPELSDVDKFMVITQLYPRVYFTIFNTPESDIKILTTHENKLQAHFIKQNIDSEQCCGFIGQHSFQIPSINGISENILFNGCLNRKMGLDKNGYIKNCPSMSEKYGNIQSDTLLDIAVKPEFKEYWKINKTKIKTCMDCEFRAICTDCRAYIEDPTDLFSKPKKCLYDPYKGIWEKSAS